MAHVPGAGVRGLDRHLRRLGESAALFCFTFDADSARAEVMACLEAAGTARVRLLLARSGHMTIELGPMPVPDEEPVSLVVDEEPVDSRSTWLRHKTTWRQVYAARRRRHPQAGDVVLVNERGEVTETTVANLAVRIEGAWWTPPLDAGCLPGIERGRLLESGEIQERPMTPAVLRAAEEILLISSLRGRRVAVVAT